MWVCRAEDRLIPGVRESSLSWDGRLTGRLLTGLHLFLPGSPLDSPFHCPYKSSGVPSGARSCPSRVSVGMDRFGSAGLYNEIGPEERSGSAGKASISP